MEAIITAATVMAMYLNVASQNGGKYAYNADFENGRVATIEVLENNNEYLSQKLQQRFSYDNAGRLLSKEVLKFDNISRKYTPVRRYDYDRDALSTTVSMSRWDAEAGGFGKAEQMTQYNMVSTNVMSVASYSIDKETDKKVLSNKMLVMIPQEDLLLAENTNL